MNAKYSAAAGHARLWSLRAWEALTIAQRAALRRCHTTVGSACAGVELPWLRLRVDTHARTRDALRSAGVLVPLDSELPKLSLSELGAMVRRAGMDSEAARSRTARARKGLRRRAGAAKRVELTHDIKTIRTPIDDTEQT